MTRHLSSRRSCPHAAGVISVFPKANVPHRGGVFFNGFYPFFDTSTGGNIDGTVAGANAGLKIGTAQTKIVPGYGPLGTRANLEAYGHMVAPGYSTLR